MQTFQKGTQEVSLRNAFKYMHIFLNEEKVKNKVMNKKLLEENIFPTRLNIY